MASRVMNVRTQLLLRCCSVTDMGQVMLSPKLVKNCTSIPLGDSLGYDSSLGGRGLVAEGQQWVE